MSAGTVVLVTRLLAGHVLWSGLGLAIGLLAALSVPLLAGYRAFTIMSGSMEPAIRTGDVIVSERISPVSARVGDVVTFPDPSDETRLVTHRVRSVKVRASDAYFETKGDANNTVERWAVPASGHIGRVAYRVPMLGYPLRWLSSPSRRATLVAVPSIALGVGALRRIWGPPGAAGRTHSAEEPG